MSQYLHKSGFDLDTVRGRVRGPPIHTNKPELVKCELLAIYMYIFKNT